MASSDQSDGPITLEEYMDVKRALAESQARVQQLMQTNKDLKQEITLLQNMVGLTLIILQRFAHLTLLVVTRNITNHTQKSLVVRVYRESYKPSSLLLLR